MNHHSFLQLSLAALVIGTATRGTVAMAQLESPIVQLETALKTPQAIVPKKGLIKSLFWQAEIGKSSLFIPLKEVEFVSVQNYKVVSSILQEGRDVVSEKSEALRVRELTISTKSQNFIRIYYIDTLKNAENKDSDQRSALKELEELRGQLATIEGQRYPVKHYPETTHKHMVEYRVQTESDVVKLYASLQKAMIDFHAYQLVSDQKADTVTTVRASENK